MLSERCCMLALKITDVKDFMNKLLIGEVFDRFSLVEASVTTFNTSLRFLWYWHKGCFWGEFHRIFPLAWCKTLLFFYHTRQTHTFEFQDCIWTFSWSDTVVVKKWTAYCRYSCTKLLSEYPVQEPVPFMYNRCFLYFIQSG